jgi:hypothetical protein
VSSQHADEWRRGERNERRDGSDQEKGTEIGHG